MAKSFPTSNWTSGDVVTPHEINKEMGDILGELNGNLDNENFNHDTIEEEKFARGSFNSIHKYKTDTAQTVTIGSSAHQQTELDIPGEDASRTMALSFTTGDGCLQIEGHVSFWHQSGRYASANYGKHGGLEAEASPNDGGNSLWLSAYCPVFLIITVDGKVVARTGADFDKRKQTRYISAYAPVGAGRHVVKMKAVMGKGPSTPRSGIVIRFDNRAIWCRVMKR